MLEVNIDLIPFGKADARKNIGTLKIENTADHPDRPRYGNYICHHAGGSVIIKDFDRSLGAFVLLKRCIEAIYEC